MLSSSSHTSNYSGVFQELYERRLIAQATHPEKLCAYFEESSPRYFYFGVDPTADSLHIGHLTVLRVAQILQNAGHRAVVVLGGGTARIGDPSGKTAMRTMLAHEAIVSNLRSCGDQIRGMLHVSSGEENQENMHSAVILNNLDWLQDLNYLDVISDVGKHFSVNRMLAAECFKHRMERGLSFLELNYMLLQSYDFYYLAQHHQVGLQIGGDDQWSHMLSGMELIRRTKKNPAFALTSPLLVDSHGRKMGKTEKGTVWLKSDRTPVLDFYQYWRNVSDRDVVSLLLRLTDMPLSEVKKLAETLTEDATADMWANAKHDLAYRICAVVHGEECASNTQNLLYTLFDSNNDAAIHEVLDPTWIPLELFQQNSRVSLVDVMVSGGIVPSKKEARRLITQGGVQLNGETCVDPCYEIVAPCLQTKGGMLLKRGKKTFYKLKLAPE